MAAVEAGRELDHAVHERVIGGCAHIWQWKYNQQTGFPSGKMFEQVCSKCGSECDTAVQPEMHDETPPYSTDIAAAWQVVGWARQRLFSERLRFTRALQRVMSERLGVESGMLIAAEEIILLVEPVDLCRAALLALDEGPVPL